MKKYINTKKLIISVIVFLLFYFSSLFQIIPIYIFHIKSSTPTLNILLNMFSNIILLGILYLIYRNEIKEEWKIFKKKPLENINTGCIYWFIGLIIMVVTNLLINKLIAGGIANNENTVQSMIKTLPWMMLINAGLIAPINEEITFRKAFKNVFKTKWLFAIASGFVFGFLHVAGADSIGQYLYIIPYGTLGVCFALAYYKTNTIFTSMFLHMFHNTVLILMSIFLTLI